MPPKVVNHCGNPDYLRNLAKNYSKFRFVAELDGLDAILDFLAALDYGTAQSSIHSALLACLKALMNNSVSIIQGDQAACPKPPVDIDVKVAF